MKIQTEIMVYELDGSDVTAPLDKTIILIKNHWNENRKVLLCVNGTEYAVVADDLKRAIGNAVNHGF